VPEERGVHERAITTEFERVAPHFAERTRGRFDHLDAVAFSRVGDEATVAEIGAGTGNFLSLFAGGSRTLVAVDITPAMLREAAARNAGMHVVAAHGHRLPLRSGSVDLVTSAQVLHHVPRPLGFIAEMRRVAAPDGRVLIVDQVATERHEEAVAMTELELARDPTHAASRPRAAFHVLVQAAGLRVVDERIVISRQRFSDWMWPGEFPPERIDATRTFIETRGDETGMNFERDGDDFVFDRRRIMLLAARA
jgi:ubiquinone/menaquinone biosynthesis C-methylase UbiE